MELWYYSKEKIQKIIDSNKFEYINEGNRKNIQERLNKCYRHLNNENRKIFTKNVDILYLLTQKDCFVHVSEIYDERKWLLLILDYKNQILYNFYNY